MRRACFVDVCMADRNAERYLYHATCLSRNAVSAEHLVSLAYFDIECFPSKPSRSRLMTMRCLSFTGASLIRSQTFAFRRTPANSFSAPSMARPRQVNPNTEVEDCDLWGAHSSRVLAEASRLSELGAVSSRLLARPPLPTRHTKGRCSGTLQPTRGTHVLPGKESSVAGSSPYPASEFRFNLRMICGK